MIWVYSDCNLGQQSKLADEKVLTTIGVDGEKIRLLLLWKRQGTKIPLVRS